MTKQFLQASPQGIQTIRQALKRKKWSQTDLAGFVYCSRQSIGSLLKGEPKESNLFKSVCEQLGLNWEDIAEPESAEPEAIDPSNIDNLVQEVRDRIRPLIQQSCGTMRVLDMSYPIGLDDIYTEVNILERITSRRSLELRELMLAAGREEVDRSYLGDVRQERVPALEAVEQFSKLMILGKPGAGKTTFLKRLAMMCIGGKFKADHVPVFVTLKEFAEEEGKPSLLEYLNELSGTSFEAIVQAGKAMILLDGLDEVREADSGRVLRQIKTFSHQLGQTFGQNCFFITCRVAAQADNSEELNFAKVRIADFDNLKIIRFINKWFSKDKDAAKSFWREVNRNRSILSLTKEPLLLTLLCSEFEKFRQLPVNRVKLYAQVVDQLLRSWNTRSRVKDSVYEELSSDYREELLSEIAWHTFPDNIVFSHRDIKPVIRRYLRDFVCYPPHNFYKLDTKAMLESIEVQHGLLIEQHKGEYIFSHLTFHEYFVARRISNQFESGVMEEPLKMLADHIMEAQWQEVFLFAAEMLPSADYLLKQIKIKVDQFLKNHRGLQSVLAYVYEKAELVEGHVSYKCLTVRAFYFHSFIDPGNLNCRIAHISDVKFTLSSDHNTARIMNHLPIEVRRWIFMFSPYNDQVDGSSQFECELDIDMSLISILDIDKKLRSQQSKIPINFIVDHLTQASGLTSNIQLQERISMLIEKLPPDEHQACIQWKQNEYQDWNRELKEVIASQRHIDFEYVSKLESKEVLQQYYNMNLLLVKCLNSGCRVSSEVRQEIEETLLLPIADIEAWKKERGRL